MEGAVALLFQGQTEFVLPDDVLQLLDSPQIGSLACGSGLGVIQLQGAPNASTFSPVTFSTRYHTGRNRREMNGPLKGTPHVDYCLLTAPGVCVQIWDLMCSSTFVQGVVITVVTVHTHVCVSFLHSILMDYDSTKYAVEGALTPLGSRMCVSTRTRHSAV